MLSHGRVGLDKPELQHAKLYAAKLYCYIPLRRPGSSVTRQMNIPFLLQFCSGTVNCLGISLLLVALSLAVAILVRLYSVTTELRGPVLVHDNFAKIVKFSQASKSIIELISFE